VGDIDFEVISGVENSDEFQKTRFLEGKNSVEDVETTRVHIMITFNTYLRSFKVTRLSSRVLKTF